MAMPGQDPEARKVVEEIYDWFTEGFDTKDLQEAEALLDNWAAGKDREENRVQDPGSRSLEPKHVQNPKPVLPAPVPQAQVSS